eukprot:Filipodium_phascolosomae@DN5638_c0_g1_i1.p1
MYRRLVAKKKYGLEEELPRGDERLQGNRPVIFLDVDGVLHTVDGRKLLRRYCMRTLAALVGRFNAQLVLSSSWRRRADNMRLLNMKLRMYNLEPVASITPCLRGECRATEILYWLYLHPKVWWWIVVDDAPIAFPGSWSCRHTVRTDGAVGLTESAGQLGMALLESQWLRSLCNESDGNCTDRAGFKVHVDDGSYKVRFIPGHNPNESPGDASEEESAEPSSVGDSVATAATTGSVGGSRMGLGQGKTSCKGSEKAATIGESALVGLGEGRDAESISESEDEEGQFDSLYESVLRAAARAHLSNSGYSSATNSGGSSRNVYHSSGSSVLDSSFHLEHTRFPLKSASTSTSCHRGGSGDLWCEEGSPSMPSRGIAAKSRGSGGVEAGSRAAGEHDSFASTVSSFSSLARI